MGIARTAISRGAEVAPPWIRAVAPRLLRDRGRGALHRAVLAGALAILAGGPVRADDKRPTGPTNLGRTGHARALTPGAARLVGETDDPRDDARTLVSAEVRDRVLKSLVGIRAHRTEPRLSFRGRLKVTAEVSPAEGIGTGIVVDPSGLILTCAHVVAGESKVTVVLPDAREILGTVSAIDPASDLALIKVESANLAALDLRRAPKLRQGGLLYLVSRPGGAIARFTEGTLAAEGTFHAGHSDIEFLRQFLGKIEPGDSGGALVDDQGQLVGLLSSGVPQGRVGYAIARELVILALARLREGPPVVWPWIGVGVEMTPDGSGVQAWTVAKGSPAEAAGLRTGDRICALDGHPIEHFLPAMMAVIARPVGTRFRIEVRRQGSDAATVVRLVSAPRPLEPDLRAFDVFEKLTGIRLGAEPAVPGSAGRVVVLDAGAPASSALSPSKGAPTMEPPEHPAYARGSRLVSVLPGFGVVLSLEEGRDDQEIPIASAEDLGQALRASTIGTTMTAVLVWSTDGKRRTMLLSGEAKRFPVL